LSVDLFVLSRVTGGRFYSLVEMEVRWWRCTGRRPAVTTGAWYVLGRSVSQTSLTPHGAASIMSRNVRYVLQCELIPLQTVL